jgi:Uma2 family endonuclease
MTPKGNRYEMLKAALTEFWVPRMPKAYRLVTETTFRIDEDSFLEPDFVFYRKTDGLAKLTPATALLVVEVADSSLEYDLRRKAQLYAVHGVRETWVIDAVKLETHIRRRPLTDGYTEKLTVGSGDTAAPEFAPELAVSLGALELV